MQLRKPLTNNNYRNYNTPLWKQPKILAAISATAIVGVTAIILTNATAATYYVSPTGSDGNSGKSESLPFKTIQKAMTVARAGTTIKLAPGKYREAVVTKYAGAKDNPIVVQGPETGKDVNGRYKAVLYSKGGHTFDINHSYYTLKGFTIDGQEKIARSEYPTSLSQVKTFKDSVQGRTVNSKLVYIGASDSSRDITGVVLDNMFMNGAGGECVRMRNRAAANRINNSVIQWCGMKAGDSSSDKYKYHNGEGVYIGTSPVSTDQPLYSSDTSNNNIISNTNIRTYGSECFNVKENAHRNVMENGECKNNDEPVEFKGSLIEFRGDNNRVVNVVLSGSRGYGFKMRSDATKYDKGGNSVRNSQFLNVSGPAINSEADPAKVGEFCGNSFSATGPIVDGKSVGDPARPCQL